VAPLKKFKQKSEVNLPYYDKELVFLASFRDKTYKQAIREKDPVKINSKRACPNHQVRCCKSIY
jgi:hypothetical protein